MREQPDTGEHMTGTKASTVRPDCDVCHGTGEYGYTYCNHPHAVKCWKCFPARKCPGCGADWYSPENHHPGCANAGTTPPSAP